MSSRIHFRRVNRFAWDRNASQILIFSASGNFRYQGRPFPCLYYSVFRNS
jgi:hypothetical protein